jgi:prepilin-type N-terminal cleavage/methylation domain-containing protein
MRGARASSGLTLIELLVVIAVIATLAALFFPVLNKGRRNAQTAYDLNNSRQIMMAAQMYAGDNDDSLPQPGWGNKVASWAAGADMAPGGAQNYQGYTNALARQLDSFRQGQLYSWLKEAKLLRCPADNVINEQYFKRNIYISSYVWNAAVLGFPSKIDEVATRLTFKLRQFRPNAILLWEADEMRPFDFDMFAAYPDEGVSQRHQPGATVGRFDGAAERMPLSEFLAHSGNIAGDFQHAGKGWQTSRIAPPNRVWCSPLHRGVPDDPSDDPWF